MTRLLKIILLLAIMVCAGAVSAQEVTTQPDGTQIFTFADGSRFTIPDGMVLDGEGDPPQLQIGLSIYVEMVDPAFIGSTPDSTRDANLTDILDYILGLINHEGTHVPANLERITLNDGREAVYYTFTNTNDRTQVVISLRMSDGRVAAMNVRMRNPLTSLQRTQIIDLASMFDSPVPPAADLFERAQAAFDAQDYQAAADLLERFVTQNGENQEAHYMRGHALTQTGDLVQAQSAYERAYELAPTEIEILYDIANVQALSDNITGATRTLEAFIKANGSQNIPDNVNDALDVYDRLLDGEVISEFYVARAQKLQEIGLYENALEDISLLIEQSPDDAALYVTQGAVYTEMERYDLALDAYSTGISITPLPTLFYSRAMLRQTLADEALEDTEDALHDYQCAILLADETITDQQFKAIQRSIESIIAITSGFKPITDPALCAD